MIMLLSASVCSALMLEMRSRCGKELLLAGRDRLFSLLGVSEMTLVNNDRPDNLMPALLEVRNSGKCSTLEFSCVVDTLKAMAQHDVATWLESHGASYHEIITTEFSQWLEEHSPHEEESLAQAAAAATGLEMPEDSFS